MKIRTGFVSNSSSSSFVIICKDATLEDALKEDKTIAFLERNNGFSCEGSLLQFIDTKTRAWLDKYKDHENISELNFYEIIAADEGVINLDSGIIDLLHEGVQIISEEVSMHTIDNEEDFKNMLENI